MQNLFGLKWPAGSGQKGVASKFAKAAECLLAAVLIMALMVTPGMAPPVEAAGQTRTLKLYFIHTGEKAQITFKKNGRFDSKGLQQINRFLRDWRRNEPTKMDPRLLDLVWEVYQKSGARDYIHVVSAYRSPATNGMLRSRSKGVAKKSQHMLGKAMDFYIPGVKLKTLREIGMKFQVGGVGYYPTSGSPFVHMDVGGVRAWPRMSRSELVRLFPDGKTVHLPSDGKPLPGYQVAIADYKRRVGASAIEVAGGGAKQGDKKRRGNLFATLFGGGGDEDEEPTAIASAEIEVAEEKPVSRRAQAAASEQQDALPGVAGSETIVATNDQPVQDEQQKDINAPIPLIRPAFKDAVQQAGMEVALVEPQTTAAQAALEAAVPADGAQTASEFADLGALKIPVPQMLADRNKTAASQDALMLASAETVTENAALGFVPVPAFRPAGEQALAAVTGADVAVPTFVERTETAQAEADAAKLDEKQQMAALDTKPVSEQTPVAIPEQDPASLANADAAEDLEEGVPVELAALVPETEQTTKSASLFEDAFGEQPVVHEEVTKGSRPKKEDADAVSRSSTRTEPKLTQKIISQWALTNDRVATISKPVKAPRFVSKTMRVAPTTVYSEGFTTNTASIDAGRFSGNAVNFLAVKKFSTN
ncbi:DUF882 domain-containing protein [Pararhizobium sp.]|uniref:DUF882 domain-containing protein n=1 Tax=Pararhizobium sp. TaxID=1977563 RepID=UPI0027177197|nr:DUF882 domain-containing protein [Pararhizobium sp.]MDO9415173.1 DUF882 domain-containing protein [Pararhizobium sp.]